MLPGTEPYLLTVEAEQLRCPERRQLQSGAK